MKRTLLRRLGAAVAVALVAVSVAAWLPVRFDSREELFEIPKGTWARRRSGDNVEILPARIRLVVGLRDILVLRNLDEVPQIFGPTLIMPGQTFRLPFETASEYQFACTAHVSGQMTVVVEDAPRSGWKRLHWRTAELLRAASQLWKRGVDA
jgi:hypothetical protein